MGYSREWIARTDDRLGQRIRAARSALGMSQNVLTGLLNSAHGLGWHQSTIAKIEAGTRPVRIAEALAIADVLSVQLDDLVYDPETGPARGQRAQRLIGEMAEARRFADAAEQRYQDRRAAVAAMEAAAMPTETSTSEESDDDGEHPAPA